MNLFTKTGDMFKGMFKKIKEADYKRLFRGKGVVIAGSVLLVGAVVAAVAIISSQADKSLETLNNESHRTLGQSVLVNGDVSAVDNEGDDYLTVAAMTRETTRTEAIAALQEIIDNPDVLPDTKDDALADMNALINEKAKEANIETLIKSKGLTNCLAVLSGINCSVIVKSTNLEATDIAQILEIVYNETGIDPDNVRIIPTK